MNKDEIISKLEAGLKTLIEQDGWLLENDLSERSIAHRLAFHLQILFDGYTVDCEYNGAVGQEPFARKKVQMVKRELLGAELELRKREQDFLDDQLIERSAYPDIIIHQRGTNENNLCIIEIKKSTSLVGAFYDEIKLRSYTKHELENALCYQLGVFLEITTGREEPDYSLRFFTDGEGCDL